MSAAINKFLRFLEGEMKMDELVQGFMVDLDVDSKNGSVAGHSIDMRLRLVAPEYNAKPWNRTSSSYNSLMRGEPMQSCSVSKTAGLAVCPGQHQCCSSTRNT